MKKQDRGGHTAPTGFSPHSLHSASLIGGVRLRLQTTSGGREVFVTMITRGSGEAAGDSPAAGQRAAGRLARRFPGPHGAQARVPPTAVPTTSPDKDAPRRLGQAAAPPGLRNAPRALTRQGKGWRGVTGTRKSGGYEPEPGSGRRSPQGQQLEKEVTWGPLWLPWPECQPWRGVCSGETRPPPPLLLPGQSRNDGEAHRASVPTHDEPGPVRRTARPLCSRSPALL